MSRSAKPSLLSDLRAQLGAVASELREMAALRWQLARLELRTALQAVARLAIIWLTAVVMILTALPLAFVALADVLDGIGNISRTGWLAIFAAGLLLAAILGSYFAWRRFRRRFAGLRETLEEFREDVVWLRDL